MNLEILGSIKKNRRLYYICKCKLCGNIKEMRAERIKKGTVKSCGCSHIKHNLAGSKITRVIKEMKQRCYNPKSTKYNIYGARGIKICDEWMDKNNGIKNFIDWAMANGYKEGLSIDRIDNNGNYEPSNCRWTTAKEQARNTRSNRKIEYKGKQYRSITELMEAYNLPSKIFYSRSRRGWSLDKILNTKVKQEKKYKYNDGIYTFEELKNLLNKKQTAIYNYIKKGLIIKL